MGKLLLALFLATHSVPLRGAEQTKVLNLETGERRELKALASQSLVVFIEENCKPCEKYVQTLQKCPQALSESVSYVSLSSSLKTKKLKSQWKIKSPVYIVLGPRPADLKGTPTTWSKGALYLGPLSCENLAKLKDSVINAL